MNNPGYRHLALSCVLALGGCITPPAIQDAGEREISLGDFPAGTERIELRAKRGGVLRGVFVPADPGAPVVLHLLESQGSITYGTRGLLAYPVLWQLRDRGFASLAVDYRGVGASSGIRSPRHLRADARAAFDEAVRRAGGDESRVIVRGLSIGSLAAATLLHDGATPGAVILVAPVRSETVARNWTYRVAPDALAFLVTPLLRDPVDVDLVRVLEKTQVPLVVHLADKDFFLPRDEQALVERAVQSASGWWITYDLGHVSLVLDGHSLLDPERALCRTVFPGWPDAAGRAERIVRALLPEEARLFAPGNRARALLEGVSARYFLDSPEIAGALALVRGQTDRQREGFIVEWLRGVPKEAIDALPFEALTALADFRDPAGNLDPGEMRPLARCLERARREIGSSVTPEALAAWALRANLHRRGMQRGDTRAQHGIARLLDHEVSDSDAAEAGEAIARLKLPPGEAHRQVVRLLLKGAGIPDRVVVSAAGYSLEVFEQGAWRALPLSPAPSLLASGETAGAGKTAGSP